MRRSKINSGKHDYNNNSGVGSDNKKGDIIYYIGQQMKRDAFLATILGFTAAPIAFGGKYPVSYNSEGKGFKINAGEGRIHGHMKLRGINENILDLKVSGSDTNGALAIFEQTSISQGRGTPLHLHHFQDEIFYVVEGEYYFQVGDAKHTLKVGDSIFLPRKVPHAWTQVSPKGKLTVIFQPAGKMEEFFLTVSALEKEPTAEEIGKIFTENEMQIVGPPLKLT